MLDSLLNALNTLNAADFAGTADCIPQPYLNEGTTTFEIPKYDLPSVLVPPEIIEVEGITSEAGSDEGRIKKEEWPEYYFRVFPNDVRSRSFFPGFPSSPLDVRCRRTLVLPQAMLFAVA